MRLSILLLTFFVLLHTPFLPALSAAELVLAENGQTPYVIAIPQQDENRRAARAAEALQRYLKEATGADFAIVTEDQVTGRAIYIGKTAKGEAAGVPYADLKDYTHCEMASEAGDVFLAGLDASPNLSGPLQHHDKEYLAMFHGLHPDIKDRSYKEWRGSHKAVLSFLEDWCGIRFLLPGDNGRFIPKVNRLAIPADLHKVTVPDFAYCYGRNYGDWDTTIALNHNDIPYYKNYGGHSFNVAVPAGRFAESHPEYFILKDGKRQPKYGPAGGNHLCVSNHEVQELMLEEFGRQYDCGFRWIQIAPTDGQVECECDECKKLHPDKSERQWLVFRKLAEQIAVRWPDAHPVFLAYGFTSKPPQAFDSFPDNTVVELCIWGQIEQRLQEWSRFQNLSKLVYIYFFGSYHATVFNPVRSPKYITENLRVFKKYNVTSIYKCGWAACLGLEGPTCYLFSKLLEDVSRDPQEILKEFYTCAYGKAASQMERFFSILYGRLDTPRGNSIIEELEARPRNPEFIILYANSIYGLGQMRNLLGSAIAAAKDEDPRVKARLALVKREFDFLHCRTILFKLDDAFSAFPCPDLVNLIEAELKKRDQLLAPWFDSNGKMLHEPGFEWPFLEDVTKDVLYYGGGQIIASFPRNFRHGVGPLKVGLKMATNPEDHQFPISDIRNLDPHAWTKRLADRWMLFLGGPDYPTRFIVAKAGDKLLIHAKCYFSKTTSPANKAEWQKTPLSLSEEQLEIWIDDRGEGKRFCHFACNPFGERAQSRRGFIADPLHPDANKVETSWQAPWDCVTEFTDNGWTATFLIPLETLQAQFLPAHSWRINLARNGRPWSQLPGTPDFSEPAAYGIMDIR
jgi:hypothetical protein